MTDLATLNALSSEDFTSALEGVFERAPWVAGNADGRPFASIGALHAAMMRVLQEAGEAAQRDFLNNHEPLVAGPLPASLTASSRLEQGDVPLGALIDSAALAQLNTAYQNRFGFPFIICLRRHTAANVLRQFHQRLAADPTTEIDTALTEVGHVTRYRLLARITATAASHPPGRIAVAFPQALAHPAELSLTCEGQFLSRQTIPAGETGPLVIWQEAPLKLGHYHLVMGSITQDIWPEDAEAECLVHLGA